MLMQQSILCKRFKLVASSNNMTHKRRNDNDTKDMSASPEKKIATAVYAVLDLGDQSLDVETQCLVRKDIEIEVLDKIAAGDYGTVNHACMYAGKGKDKEAEKKCKRVVVKVILYEDDLYEDEDEFLAAFERECEAGKDASKLELGPHIYGCWKCKTVKRLPQQKAARPLGFIVMEQVQGTTALDTELPWDDAKSLLQPLVTRLAKWHQLGRSVHTFNDSLLRSQVGFMMTFILATSWWHPMASGHG